MTIQNFFTLLGGVGLFLYGMTAMSNGLQNAAGDKLRGILEHVTSNKYMGVLLGIGVTVMIQSSSATDMMVIGFVNSGLMEIAQAIGVIMGANIGTTVTAQITAFDLSAFAPVLLFAGCVMFLFMKKLVVKNIGNIIMGFGMLFVGISLVKSAIAPLAQSSAFIAFLSKLSNPLLAILFGVAFTALLQSSSSSVVIFQTFAIQGMLDYHTAVYLVIGAAIGSVAPNILASLTTNRNGKRTALLNFLFNIFRAVFLCVLINVFPQILSAIRALSPGNIGRQVANTHTIFAILAVFVMLPFSDKIAHLTEVLIPVLPQETISKRERRLMYMTDVNHTLPTVTIRQAIMETERMGNLALSNLKNARIVFFESDEEVLEKVRATEEIVGFLSHEINSRLLALTAVELPEADAFRASNLTMIVSDFDRINAHAHNIVGYADQVADPQKAFSKHARRDMYILAEQTERTIELAIRIFVNEEFDLVPEAQILEDIVNQIESECVEKHIGRVIKGKCDPLSGMIYTDICAEYERCADHAFKISKALAPRKMLEDLEME